MRAVGIEVVRVFVEHCHGVPFVEEQESGGAFFTGGADESFGVAVRARCPGWGFDDLYVLGGEDGVERGRVFGVAVADEEPEGCGAFAEVGEEVAGGLVQARWGGR
nr:hypothetical protein [Saccharopolyspora pogona]